MSFVDSAKNAASQASDSIKQFRDAKKREADAMTDHQLADRLAYGYMAVGLLAVILFIVGFAHGFGASSRTSSDANKGVCCKECVQSFGKFLGLVVGIPFGVFLLILIVMVSIYGQSNVIRGLQGQQKRLVESKDKAFKSAYDESTVGKWIIGAGVGSFVLLGLILFFTGPTSLAGTNKAP
jgi:hypothetical protein